MCKIWCSKRVKSYALLCCVIICYADLFYEQNTMLSMSKILWSVMLCLWWHEFKSKIDMLCWYYLWAKSYGLLWIWPFTEHSDSVSYPDQSGRNQMFQVPTPYFSSTQRFSGDAHPLLFINLQDFRGVPTPHFYEIHCFQYLNELCLWWKGVLTSNFK